MYKLIPLLALLCILTKSNGQGSPIPPLLKQLDTAKDRSKPMIYSKVGQMYMMEDKFDSAIHYANLGLGISKKLKDEVGIADAHNNLGSMYRILSNYEKAMGLFIVALRTYEKKEEWRKAARTIANISVIYSEQKEFDQANQKLVEAIAYATKAKDTLTLIQLHNSSTDNYIRLKKMDSARIFIAKAEQFLSARKNYIPQNPNDSAANEQVRNYTLRLKINIMGEEGNYQEAIDALKKDIEEKGTGLGVASRVYAYKEIAKNYNRMKNYPEAINYLDQSLLALKEDSIPDLYMQVYELRSTAFAGMGNYEPAYTSYVSYKMLSDSLLNEKNFQTISDLQISYDTEKKEQEIVALNQKRKNQRMTTILLAGGLVVALGFLFLAYRSRILQQKLYQQEREIELKNQEQKISELEQMALRAQMNPHFIFNSLNAVQHFVMKQDMEGVNNYLGAFAHLVRQTLDNSSRTLVSLDEEIKYLDTYLSLEKMKNNNKFDYKISVGDNIDRSATFLPGMILQPFVENSIKHGMSGKDKNDGHIDVNISRNGRLICIIEDNGIGRTRAKELRSSILPASKGMSITMNRIEAINKLYNSDISIQVDDVGTENNTVGTRVKIDLPVDLE